MATDVKISIINTSAKIVKFIATGQVGATGSVGAVGSTEISTDTQAAIDANTAKVGITTTQATAIQTNVNKLATIQENSEPNVQSDWNETDVNNDAYIKNKPTDANTTYSVSCVDGDNADEEKIRLTDNGGTTDDVVLEAGTGLSIARSGDKITFTNTVVDTDTVLTTEQVQDVVGAMVDGGTETNIAVTYDDTSGKLNFVSTDTNTQLTLVDEDDMSSNSATSVPSQQSVKAYADTKSPLASPTFSGTIGNSTTENVTLRLDNTHNGGDSLINFRTSYGTDKNVYLGIDYSAGSNSAGGFVMSKAAALTNPIFTIDLDDGATNFTDSLQVDGQINSALGNKYTK